jgi:hypothetical protein
MRIEESELRAYIKCSEFHHKGGNLTASKKLQYVENLYNRLVQDLLKDINFDYKQSLYFHSRYLETKLLKQNKNNIIEIQEDIRHAVLAVNQVLEILNPSIYIPIFGPFDYFVNISHSSLRLNINSLQLVSPRVWGTQKVSRAKTLHAISFVPYNTIRDMESDLISLLKVQTLGANTPLSTTSTEAKLHLFSTNNSNEDVAYTSLQYDKSMEKRTWLEFLEQPVKLLETKYHFPLTPCAHSCEFKPICFPARRLK